MHFQINALAATSKKPVVKEMLHVTVAASFVWMIIQSKDWWHEWNSGERRKKIYELLYLLRPRDVTVHAPLPLMLTVATAKYKLGGLIIKLTKFVCTKAHIGLSRIL